jgi:hypothetical protein
MAKTTQTAEDWVWPIGQTHPSTPNHSSQLIILYIEKKAQGIGINKHT